MSLRPQVNGERLLKRLDDFATIGATPAGGVNRQALSPEDRAARSLLASLAIERSFAVFQDDMANLFIRREGKNPQSPPFLIGSHLDSQPTGGRFDGALGTLSAFEVLEALEDAGIETGVPVEVVAWTNEEGSRFTPGAMGSRAFSEGHIPYDWQSARGADGSALTDELKKTIAGLPDAVHRKLGAPLKGYLELHIEQGPSLEHENLPIGIVTGIQGTVWLEVTICGQAAHAGTTQLAFRRDPMNVATAILHELYSSIMPNDELARLTIGRISAEPGSVNAIPGSVVFTVDLRHPDLLVLSGMEQKVRSLCAEKARDQSCASDVRKSFEMNPATFSEPLLGLLQRACANLELPFKNMISGAFHDALFLARVTPAAMIFVPCRDGLSHNEAEFVEPDHAITGARLLLEATMMAAG